MINISRFQRSLLYIAIAIGATPFAVAQEGQLLLEEIIVTAQRKSEMIQEVPMAVSAFNAIDLSERRLDDARDLQTAVPNLSFTGTGIGGTEGFQIRAVGNSVGGVTGDVGVGIHRNNAPQVQSRISISEAYDMERIEVLRGPQGTLYGRNSTGGVINYITAKPYLNEFDFSATVELGNYNTRRIRGMVNIPMGDSVALRIAGNTQERDGFTDNIDTGNDIDNRDIWSGRISLALEPTDWLNAWVLYEKFDEDDKRSGGARGVCIKDPGPTSVGGVPIAALGGAFTQLLLSQGCKSGSIYSNDAFANTNSVSTFGGRFASRLWPGVFVDVPNSINGIVPFGDLFADQPLPTDLRETSAHIDPSFDVQQEITEFEINAKITDSLTLSLLGHYSEDQAYTVDGAYESTTPFISTIFTPGGQWNDFQLGASDNMRSLAINDYYTEQQSLELRLQSDFDGPINFNVGILDFQVERDTHTWFSSNIATLSASVLNCGGVIQGCNIYWDTNARPDYTGHQYFDTYTPYNLDSQAVFGEVYWQTSDTFKVTVGLRQTADEKQRDRYPIILLVPLGQGGVVGAPGYDESQIVDDRAEFDATTGRLILDWMPDLSWTDRTLFYTSYSRGYKSGGFNSPDANSVQTSSGEYDPEFVNAYEIGTKNTFAGGRGLLNASLFYYDYEDYQISKLESFSARNENIDAEVYGLEIESNYQFGSGFAMGATLGWLDSKIKEGESIDPMDRTAGNPDYIAVQSPAIGCIAEITDVLTAFALGTQAQVGQALFDGCSSLPGGVNSQNPLTGGWESIPGINKDLKGNQLPNAPEFSAGVNLRYRWEMGSWNSSAVLDYSWKDDSYVSVFNNENYALESWDNTNFTLNFTNYNVGLSFQLYVKNVFDEDTIVNFTTGTDSLGLTRGLTLLDPRTYGLAGTYFFE